MIKTFRKDTGGYALLYVMVVVAVVCSIVMIISASAVKNYQTQQDSVARMADKYAAEGEIEKILAEMNHSPLLEGTQTYSALRSNTGAEPDVIGLLDDYAEKAGFELEEYTLPDAWTADEGNTVIVTTDLTETAGSVTVAAEVELSLRISYTPDDTATATDETSYQLSAVSVSVTSYTVGNGGAP